MLENTRFYLNNNVIFCQAIADLSSNILTSFFSSLQVGYKSTTECLTGWNNLWNKLLKEPDVPNIAEVIDTCMKVLLLLVFCELMRQAEGGQNG